MSLLIDNTLNTSFNTAVNNLANRFISGASVEYVLEDSGKDYIGNDVTGGTLAIGSTLQQCSEKCNSTTGCVGFNRHTDGRCWLKSAKSTGVPSTGFSYYKKRPADEDYENISDTKFLLVSKASGGQCLEQVKQGRGENDRDAYISKDCNTGNPNQKIQLVESNSDFSFKTGVDNYMVVTGWVPNVGSAGETSDDVRALWENDRSGINNNMQQHGWFKIYGTGKNTGKSGRDALVKGPVKIGSSHFHWKRFHMEDVDNWKGERLRNYTNADTGASNDAQTFIHYGLLQKCKSRGIAFDDCTKTLLEDCTDVRNHNITQCPKDYCTKPENVSKPECKTTCTTNPGWCDRAASIYCDTDLGKSDEFCNCFGEYPKSRITEQLEANDFNTLRRECNLPKCITNTNSYKTNDMKRTCPPLQFCIQGITAGDVAGDSTINNVNITCAPSSGNPPAPTAPAAPPAAATAATAALGIPPIYFAIGGIVVFLLLLVLAFRG